MSHVSDPSTCAHALTYGDLSGAISDRDAVKVELLAAVAPDEAVPAALIERLDDAVDDHG